MTRGIDGQARANTGHAVWLLCGFAACTSNDWEIEGTVRSATTNEPVYRAKVSLACGAHGAPDPRDMTTQTDDRGRYALAGKGSNPADCSVKIEEDRFIRQETKLSEGAFKKGNVGGRRLTLDSALTPRK
jgi:hypothetical protein